MRLIVTSAVVVSFLIASPAAAKNGRHVKTSDTKKGYAYDFEDDALDAVPSGARGAHLRVRRGAQRSVLIRPRTQFITELLKSAENL